MIIFSFLLCLLIISTFGFWKIDILNLIYSSKEKIQTKNSFSTKEFDEIFNSQINVKNFEATGFNQIIMMAESNIDLPRIYFSKIPIYLEKQTPSKKKQLFVSILLPIILKANELVLQERKLMKIAFLENNIKIIEYYSKKYRIKNFKKTNFYKLSSIEFSKIKEQLLNKINKIPTSMVLAQAAIESGWGSSRFAKQGNALFGEWTWKNNVGLKPKKNPSANYSVKSFLNISESINSYMLNLNSHQAYKKMRFFRSSVLNTGKALSGYKMANYLNKYSETGFDYTMKVKDIIKANKFNRFDNSKLKKNNNDHLMMN